MKKQLRRVLEENPLTRLLFAVGVVFVIFALVWLVNFIMHGSGAQERQLMEAITKSYAEKNISGTLTVKSQTNGTNMQVNGSYGLKNQSEVTASAKITGNFQGANIDVPVEYRSKGEAMYLKLANIDAFTGAMGPSLAQYKSIIDPVVAKVNDRWIHIAAQKNAQNDCTMNLLKKVSTDTSARDELTGAYIMNRFLRITGKNKSDATTELFVTVDEQATRSFVQSLKSKEFFKHIPSCDSSYSLMPEATAQTATARSAQQTPPPSFKVVINNGTQRISDIEVASAGSSITSHLSYDKPVEITAPTESIPAEELQRDLAPLSAMANSGGLPQMQPGMMGMPTR
jgi:hypothetical protein